MCQCCRYKMNRPFSNSIAESGAQEETEENTQGNLTEEEEDYCFVPGYN
jgi:hypothetical protein